MKLRTHGHAFSPSQPRASAVGSGPQAPKGAGSGGPPRKRRLEGALAAAGLASKLEDLGLDAAACEEMSREAARRWAARFNPRPVAAEDLLEIHRRAI